MFPPPSPRDCKILQVTSLVNVATRRQLQSYCEGDHKDRQMRRSCERLSRRDLLRRSSPIYADPLSNSAAYVYSSTENGLYAQAEQSGDPTILLRPHSPPETNLVRHEILVTETQLILMKSVEAEPDVELVRPLRRGHIINPEEPDQTKHRTFTFDLSNGKPLYCEPDFAFELKYHSARVGFCMELETGANGAKRKIARCHQGYEALADQSNQRFAELFPEVTKGPFIILAVAPTAGYRDAMRKAIADKPTAGLWRFAVLRDLNPQSFLFEPIWYRHDMKNPVTLLNR